MRRFSFPKRWSERQDRLDCHRAAHRNDDFERNDAGASDI
jgi:hypothetical protein